MARAISITEILGTIHDGTVEVCASADAEYDPATEQLSVMLGACARRVSASGDGQHCCEPWLPGEERVSEHLPRSDVDEFTKDVFQSWVRKVRASVPPDLALRS